MAPEQRDEFRTGDDSDGDEVGSAAIVTLQASAAFMEALAALSFALLVLIWVALQNAARWGAKLFNTPKMLMGAQHGRGGDAAVPMLSCDLESGHFQAGTVDGGHDRPAIGVQMHEHTDTADGRWIIDSVRNQTVNQRAEAVHILAPSPVPLSRASSTIPDLTLHAALTPLESPRESCPDSQRGEPQQRVSPRCPAQSPRRSPREAGLADASADKVIVDLTGKSPTWGASNVADTQGQTANPEVTGGTSAKGELPCPTESPAVTCDNGVDRTEELHWHADGAAIAALTSMENRVEPLRPQFVKKASPIPPTNAVTSTPGYSSPEKGFGLRAAASLARYVERVDQSSRGGGARRHTQSGKENGPVPCNSVGTGKENGASCPQPVNPFVGSSQCHSSTFEQQHTWRQTSRPPTPPPRKSMPQSQTLIEPRLPKSARVSVGSATSCRSSPAQGQARPRWR